MDAELRRILTKADVPAHVITELEQGAMFGMKTVSDLGRLRSCHTSSSACSDRRPAYDG